MKRLLFLTLTVLAGVFVAAPLAAGEPQEQPQVGTDEGKPPVRVADEREELKRLEQLRRAIVTELDLNDEQLLAIRDVFKEHQKTIEKHFTERHQAEESNLEKLREVKKKLEEARAAGDQATVAELSKQLQSLRGNPEALQEANRKLYEALEEKVGDSQRPALRKILERFARERDARRAPGARGIRHMRRALERVDLSSEKKNAMSTLFRDTMRKVGKDRSDPEALKKAEDQLKEQILAELNDQQKETFLKALDEIQAMPEPGRAQATSAGAGPGTPRGAQQDDGEAGEPSQP